jgi:hypothetical protein
MNNQLKKEIFNAVFQDLKGYECLYKISKNGEIWSRLYRKIMCPHIDERGYLKIVLTNEDKQKTKCSIHRLLAIQYIPNPENKPQIDHIDRNTSNNSLSNLRWATIKENNNNKSTSLLLLTDAEIEERKEKDKTYHREFAEKQRRAKGVQLKSEMTKTKDPTYIKEHRTNYLANRPEEMKQKERERNNNHYHNGGGKEYQKEHLSKPEVHQKRMEDQRKKRAGMTEEEQEKHNAKAVEYYYAHLEENRIKARERQAKKRAGMTEEQLEAERAKRRKPKA